MSESSSTPVLKLKRVSKGRKPQYFHDPATDKLHSMVLALTQELSVARDRIDTLERLIERSGLFAASAVESYLPNPEEAAVRSDRRAAMLSRIFRATEKELNEISGPDMMASEDIQQLLT